jgi:hypothetical protein
MSGLPTTITRSSPYLRRRGTHCDVPPGPFAPLTSSTPPAGPRIPGERPDFHDPGTWLAGSPDRRGPGWRCVWPAGLLRPVVRQLPGPLRVHGPKGTLLCAFRSMYEPGHGPGCEAGAEFRAGRVGRVHGRYQAWGVRSLRLGSTPAGEAAVPSGQRAADPSAEAPRRSTTSAYSSIMSSRTRRAGRTVVSDPTT